MSNLYWFMVTERVFPEAYVQNYYVRAAEIGEAVEKVAAAARLNGMVDPEVSEMEPISESELVGVLVPTPKADVFWQTEKYHFPPEDELHLPYGIIGCFREGGSRVGDLHEGFESYKDSNGLWNICINISRDKLLNVYGQVLGVQGHYDVFWYRLHDHWDEGEERFLVNEALSTRESILLHINSHPLDSYMNGFVTLTAYSKNGCTNINISDHKQVVILTFSDDLMEKYEGVLKGLGFAKYDDLASFSGGMYHWHYRHPDSRSREGLIQHLLEAGFRDWVPGG